MSFPAKYKGRCSCCGKKFDTGDEIAYLDEQIVIEGHIPLDDERKLAPGEKACTDCFLIQPKHRFPNEGDVCDFCQS